MTAHPNVPPLDGTVVLDLTRWLSGPYCTMMLADAGATVIKIEPPEGEINRYLETIVREEGQEDVSSYFLRLNRRKKSVTLDLRSDEGKAQFRELVEGADVVVENFRPGVMDRLGIGQEALRKLNPGLVFCSISGFGATETDMRSWPSFNLVAEAMSGLVRIDEKTGEPHGFGPAIGDLVPSLHAVTGILQALLRRHLTGEGSFVDIAMFDSCLSINELAVAGASIAGEEIEYGRRVNPNLAPYGLFPAKDGFVCIAIADETQWLRFCGAVGREDLAADQRLRTGAGRVDHFDDIIVPLLDEWLGVRTREEASEILAEAGVPASPVWRSSETLKTRQALQRDMAEPVFAPDGRSWPIPANPVRLTPDYPRDRAITPQAGEHNNEYLENSATASAGHH